MGLYRSCLDDARCLYDCRVFRQRVRRACIGADGICVCRLARSTEADKVPADEIPRDKVRVEMAWRPHRRCIGHGHSKRQFGSHFAAGRRARHHFAADDPKEACGWHPGYVADDLASLRRPETTSVDAQPLPSRLHDVRNEQYCTSRRSVMPSKRTWQWVSLC
jgi:hypothetical protein